MKTKTIRMAMTCFMALMSKALLALVVIYSYTATPGGISFQIACMSPEPGGSLVLHFGDGTSQNLLTGNEDVYHQYTSSGNFQACLELTSANGDTQTTCVEVAICALPVDALVTQSGSNVMLLLQWPVPFGPGPDDPIGLFTTVDWGDGNLTTCSGGVCTHQYMPGTYNIMITSMCLNTGEQVIIWKPGITIPPMPPCDTYAMPFFDIFYFCSGITIDPDVTPNPWDPNPFSIDWGDGTFEVCGTQGKSHSYLNPGSYTVCLSGFDAADNYFYQCQQVEIQDLCTCAAGSNHNHLLGLHVDCAGYTDYINVAVTAVVNLSFSNSSGIDLFYNGGLESRIYWGDGSSELLSGLEVSHVYTRNGTYRIAVEVLCHDGSPIDAADIIFNVTDAASVCALPTGVHRTVDDLTMTITGFDFAIEPGTYLGDYTFFWSFGDGTFSTESMPSHTYPEPGNFWNCWTVVCDGHEVQIYEIVSVGPVPLPTGFDYVVDGLTVTITDIEIPGFTGMIEDVYNFDWSWGDGSFSGGAFPSHEYPEPGYYTLCMKGWHEETGQAGWYYASIFLPEPDCPIPADFHALSDLSDDLGRLFMNEPHGLDVLPDNYLPVWYTKEKATPWLQYYEVWDLGDGFSTDDFNGFHQFIAPGSYEVCVEYGCARTGESSLYCKLIEVLNDAPCTDAEAWVVSRFSAEVNGNTVMPFSASPARERESVIQQTIWLYDYGDGATANTMNAPHTYIWPGDYEVSQTVTVMWADGVTATDTYSVPVHIACPGDIDGNGFVNVGDLLLFTGYFGSPCGGGSNALSQ